MTFVLMTVKLFDRTWRLAPGQADGRCSPRTTRSTRSPVPPTDRSPAPNAHRHDPPRPKAAHTPPPTPTAAPERTTCALCSSPQPSSRAQPNPKATTARRRQNEQHEDKIRSLLADLGLTEPNMIARASTIAGPCRWRPVPCSALSLPRVATLARSIRLTG